MEFRKISSVITAAVLALSLAACESMPTTPKDEQPSPQPPEEQTTTPAEQPTTAKEECKCPAPAKVPKRMDVVGENEYVRIIPGDVVMKARIDTGATSTSMTAIDLQEFERDGKTWLRFYVPDGDGNRVEITRPLLGRVSIKRHGAQSVKRPVVMMTLILGNQEQTLKVNLTDRSKYEYPLLIGRNFLQGMLMVDVSKKYHQGIPARPKTINK
ncbi:Uncharacterised protein [BD1-7 clade bacterium]|uniref:Retropepsin-like aspartic endopeptidase domain-containing protein n=1 Tax=BD1-7 clade bacterium TaxID=2029982 RepID=A0A5S9N4R2_9GAMM|nr:Uncharacterised protein [BD1-7 clade bacterium]